MWLFIFMSVAIVNSYTSNSDTAVTNGPTAGRRYTAIWLGVAMAVVALFAGASEFLIRAQVEPNDLLTRHVALLAASTSRDAVFGDSHAALGFSGQPGIINLAFPGENTVTMISKARSHYRKVRPGLVILQAGPHQFTANRDRDVGRDYDDGRVQIGGLRVLSDWHRPQLLKYWRVVLRGEEFTSNRDFQPDGSQTVAKIFAALTDAERHRDGEETVLSQIPPDDLRQTIGFKSLHDFIPQLIARGARVCLVSFPVSKAYRGLAVNYPSFAKARMRITALAARYGIRHVDFWAAFSDDAVFSNSDHMNLTGARHLARLVRLACEKPVHATSAKE